MKNNRIKYTGRLKKISLVTATALITASLALPAYANNELNVMPLDSQTENVDVPPDTIHPNPVVLEKIKILSDLGVLEGDVGGNFRPYDGISRAETAAVFSRLLGENKLAVTDETGFDDVDSTCYASGYIKFLKDKNIIQGNELGLYDPYTTVSYAEFIKFLVQSLENPYGYAENIEYSYPNGYIDKAKSYEVLNDVQIDDPNFFITRGEVALILIPALDVPLSNCNETNDGVENTEKETFRTNLSKPSSTTTNPVTNVNNFAMKMDKEISKSENYMFSPISVKMAMAMLANGADGATKTEILKVLDITDLSDYNKSVKAIIEKYNDSFDYDTYQELLKKIEDDSINSDEYEKFRALETEIRIGKMTVMNIANSLWLNTDRASENQKFKTDFEGTIKYYYNGTVNSVNSDNAVSTINNWSSEKTNGKIPEIIDNNDFLAALVNAIYFKASWENEFDTLDTKPDTFHNYNKANKLTDFMNKSDYFCYYADERVKMVRIPYKANKAAMYISVDDGDLDNYDYYFDKLENTYMDISIPKFKVEYSDKIGSSDTNSLLNKLGIKTVFNSNKADLLKMIDSSETDKFYISNVLHKTYIDVDEKGTEAAAVTAVILDCAGIAPPLEPIKFKADSPFTFIIRDELSGEILFMGRLANI